MLDYPPTLCESYNHVVLRFFSCEYTKSIWRSTNHTQRSDFQKFLRATQRFVNVFPRPDSEDMFFFFKQCHSLKNHRELEKVYCQLDYMIWPFLSVDWFDPTLGQRLIKYCIHHVPTLYTGAVGTFTHTQNKFEIFLNKKYLCSANSQVIPVIGKAGKRFVIKLHPCLSVGTFKPQRFSPKKNNVRQNWFNGEEGVAEDGSGRLKALFLRNKVILISTCNYCQLIKISKVHVMQSPVLCNS